MCYFLLQATLHDAAEKIELRTLENDENRSNNGFRNMQLRAGKIEKA
jgi:hypothetical protein